jgi:hypothetical protein
LRTIVIVTAAIVVAGIFGPFTYAGPTSDRPRSAAPTAPRYTARNLVATAQLKAALRAAHLSLIPKAQRGGVRGPLRGTTYYGSYGPWRYALATFSHPQVGTTDQPEAFSKAPGRNWRDRGDTGGCLSKGVIPLPLLRVWHLRTQC